MRHVMHFEIIPPALTDSTARMWTVKETCCCVFGEVEDGVWVWDLLRVRGEGKERFGGGHGARCVTEDLMGADGVGRG